MMHVYSNEIKNIINLYQEKVEYRTKTTNKQASLNDSVIPYFRSLQDIKIKCESYVEYLPPELLHYIFDCDGKLSIVQVM